MSATLQMVSAFAWRPKVACFSGHILILLAILIGPVSAVLGLVVGQALTVASERYRGFKKTSARPRPSTFGNG